MLQLNETNKFNWTIRYVNFNDGNLNSQKEEDTLVAEGNVYDFIPRRGEIVIINEKSYTVIGPIYDFDNAIIVISIKPYVNSLND